MENKEIQTDIEMASHSREMTVKMVDEKITVRFNSYDGREWVGYDKIFDDWKSFTKYADAFCKI